jgi:hypothetical protein
MNNCAAVHGQLSAMRGRSQYRLSRFYLMEITAQKAMLETCWILRGKYNYLLLGIMTLRLKVEGNEMIEFLRIEDRGFGLVAVFKRPFDDEPFCLNQSSLESRIANIKAGKANHSCDASVEEIALAELKRRNNQ